MVDTYIRNICEVCLKLQAILVEMKNPKWFIHSFPEIAIEKPLAKINAIPETPTGIINVEKKLRTFTGDP